MKDSINVTAFVCDGCRKRKIVESAEDAHGYHGDVAHVHEGGGTGRVEFYACSNRCIGKAVQNAIAASEEDERTDPDLAAEDLREQRADTAQAQGLIDAPEDDDRDADELESARA
jgi:hypothetical protein